MKILRRFLLLIVIISLRGTLFSQTPQFAIGNYVQVTGTQNLNVRSAAGANGTIIGSQTPGSQGRIIGGPTIASVGGVSYVWYNVDWQTGVDGWSVQDGMGLMTPPAPTLISPGNANSPGPVLSNTTQTFSWNSVSTATSYGLYIRDITTNTLDEYTINAPTTSSGQSLIVGHSYRWNMQAFNSSVASSLSTTYYFQIAASQPTLSITPSSIMQNSGISFSVTGSNYTPNGTVNRFIKYSGQTSYTQISSVTANPSGQVSWQFLPTCTDPPLGTHTLYTIDASSGRQSNTANETVTANPSCNVPSISSIGPNPVTGSNNSVLMTINGSGFLSGATITWRDLTFGQTYSNRPPSSITSTVITINAVFGTDPANWTAQVVNPSGSSSTQASFSVNAPVPTITSLSPSSATAGGPAFSLTVSGATFHRSSVVRWNGSDRTTSPLISGDLVVGLQATVSSSDIATAGTYQVTVYSPGPGGGTSSPASFTVNPLSGSPVVYGIDVSHWQNDAGPITWSTVYGSGVRFVFVKASESWNVPDGPNPGKRSSIAARWMHESDLNDTILMQPLSDHFVENIQGATSANLIAGAYHYTRPNEPRYPSDLDQSAIAEAQYFLSRAGSYVERPYLPPTLDVDGDYGLNPTQLSRWVRIWLQYVQQQHPGVIPIIYTTRSVLLTLDNDLLTNYRLWIPTDDGDPSGTPCYIGTCWPNWKFKQYRFGESGGTVSGVTGPVDLDSFNGDLAALNEFVLPIQLASFTATVLNSSNLLLRWTTISEINNYGFYIQRHPQSDSSWYELPNSFIPGHGTTNEPQQYSFIDSTLPAPSMWFYRLKQVDLDGTVYFTEPVSVNVVTSIAEQPLPTKFTLAQNYPNPFNPSTSFQFSVANSQLTILKVFDLLGREMATLVNEVKQPGTYTVQWDARGFASGVYVYRLTAGDLAQNRKLVLLR